MNIEIIIRDKIARLVDTDKYFVCGNNNIDINFIFDEEWNAHETKTARFAFNGEHIDVIFTGNTVKAPIIKNAHVVDIGVFAGNLSTTTPATMRAKRSILCNSGSPAAPTPDVYAQLMARLNDIEKNGGGNGANANVTPENIKSALGYTPADQEDVNKLSEEITNLKGSEATGISAELTGALRTYFANVQILLTQIAYTTGANIGNTVIQNAKDVVTVLENGTTTPEQPATGIVQLGSALAITSGVTVTQTGSTLAIA